MIQTAPHSSPECCRHESETRDGTSEAGMEIVSSTRVGMSKLVGSDPSWSGVLMRHQTEQTHASKMADCIARDNRTLPLMPLDVERQALKILVGLLRNEPVVSMHQKACC